MVITGLTRNQFVVLPHVGSNPTRSANEKSSNHNGFWIFRFFAFVPFFAPLGTVLSWVLERTNCDFQSFSSIRPHLLPKWSASGRLIPSTIAFAEDSLDL